MNKVKVFFDLERIDEDYPPVDVESVWADALADGTFRIDNVPFFATRATLGDIIRTVSQDGQNFYSTTAIESSNSLIRVILFDGNDPQPLRAALASLGCESELSHLSALIAVNVPANVDIAVVQKLLNAGSLSGEWDYEEPLLRQ